MYPTPREIVDRQGDAYNQRTLDAYCALYADDAELIDLPSGTVLAKGAAAIRRLYADRFSNPDLYCRVHAKIDIGDFAVDRETIFGLPGGPVDILASYEVKEGKIRRIFFVRQPVSLPGTAGKS